MDPHAEKVPGLALPKPSSEQGVHNAIPYQPGGLPEASLPSIEAAPAPGGAVVMPQPHMPALPMQPVAVAPAVPIASSLSSTQTNDDSTNALDEEWVNKAKAIVEQTRHDPHLESQELGRVKADYLRIRYNKHIKLAEDHSK